MSKRKLGAATALEVPGLYRVTWSADIQAASHDDAAALARAMQLRKGPAAFDVERMPDARQLGFMFGVGARRVVADGPAPASKGAPVARAGRVAGDGLQPGQVYAESLGAAVRAAQAAVGDRWAFVPGASVLVVLPAALRSYKSERGTVIRTRRDARVPAARFWPGGEIPAGAVLVGDYPISRATEREARRAAWAEFEWTRGRLAELVNDRRAAWVKALQDWERAKVPEHAAKPEELARRIASARSAMRYAAADWWRLRGILRQHIAAKPAKARKEDMAIEPGEVLCPFGAETDAYKAYIEAWVAANPERHTDASGFSQWIAAQCGRGDEFRYDPADRMENLRRVASVKFAGRDECMAQAKRQKATATAFAGDDGKIADWSMKDIKESVGHARDRHRDGMAILARCQPCS